MGAQVFGEIFQRVVSERGLPCESGSDELLRKLCLQLGPKELRACYPSDIVDIIASIGSYEIQSAKINRESLKRAVNLYFTRPQAPPKE